MTDTKDKKPTFAERHGLQGQGVPVRISPMTRLLVQVAINEAERARSLSELQRVQDKTLYKTPQP